VGIGSQGRLVANSGNVIDYDSARSSDWRKSSADENTAAVYPAASSMLSSD
jgi:hypothetical protein